MRNLLQCLLIAFALALCVLVGFQWHRENGLQQQLQPLTDELQKQRNEAATLSGAVKRADAEIRRLNGLLNQLNEKLGFGQAEINRLQDELKTRANPEQLDSYKKALDTANARITKQNEDMKKMADDHNNVVVQFNKMAEDYNDLVKKWNEQQEQLGKGSPATPDK